MPTGAPVFQGRNLVGIISISPEKILGFLSTSFIRHIQPSYDFICKFASCGGAFDENRNDPGHSLTGGGSSSTA